MEGRGGHGVCMECGACGGFVCLLAAAQQVIFLPHKSQNMQIKQALLVVAVAAAKEQVGQEGAVGGMGANTPAVRHRDKQTQTKAPARTMCI